MILEEIFSKFQDNTRTNCTFLEFQEISRTKVNFQDFSRSVRILYVSVKGLGLGRFYDREFKQKDWKNPAAGDMVWGDGNGDAKARGVDMTDNEIAERLEYNKRAGNQCKGTFHTE